jgi:ribosomal protein S20
LARTPRKWTGARSPGGLKRVRSSERRHEVLGPRRATAKTLVRAALDVAGNPGDQDPQASLAEALSALDRAAKTGAIHRNAAARRKSRLALKVNDLLAGTNVVVKGKTKSVGKAQAQKAAKARIAAGKAGKAKGAQTAAGKARAALSKTTRSEAAAETAAPKAAAKAAPDKPAAKPAVKAAPKSAAKKAAPAAKKAAPAAKKAAPAAKAKAPANAAAKPAAKAAAKPAAKKSSK